MSLLDKILALDTKDWLIVVATLLGPILAVQAQKYLEILRERRNAQRQVFHQLMATRGARLSNQHVQALNMIDLVFYGTLIFGFRWQRDAERAVTDAWTAYRANLGDIRANEGEMNFVYAAREERLTDLLQAMAICLGYSYDRVKISQGGYHPSGTADLENDARAFLRNAAKVLAGQQAIPMEVTKFPVDPAAAQRYKDTQEGLQKALSGESALHVQIKKDPE